MVHIHEPVEGPGERGCFYYSLLLSVDGVTRVAILCRDANAFHRFARAVADGIAHRCFIERLTGEEMVAVLVNH